jgi:hypothetical protein
VAGAAAVYLSASGVAGCMDVNCLTVLNNFIIAYAVHDEVTNPNSSPNLPFHSPITASGTTTTMTLPPPTKTGVVISSTT